SDVARQVFGPHALRGPAQRGADTGEKIDIVDARGELWLLHVLQAGGRGFACTRAKAMPRGRKKSGQANNARGFGERTLATARVVLLAKPQMLACAEFPHPRFGGD